MELQEMNLEELLELKPDGGLRFFNVSAWTNSPDPYEHEAFVACTLHVWAGRGRTRREALMDAASKMLGKKVVPKRFSPRKSGGVHV